MRDVTGRKRMEEALQKSEQNFRSLVETMHEGLGVLDEEENHSYVKRRFAEVMGHSGPEIIGRSPAEFTDESDQRFFADRLTLREETRPSSPCSRKPATGYGRWLWSPRNSTSRRTCLR